MKRLRLSVRFDGQREVPEPRWLLALEALADSLHVLADRRRREWERKTYGVVFGASSAQRYLSVTGRWSVGDGRHRHFRHDDVQRYVTPWDSVKEKS